MKFKKTYDMFKYVLIIPSLILGLVVAGVACIIIPIISFPVSAYYMVMRYFDYKEYKVATTKKKKNGFWSNEYLSSLKPEGVEHEKN
jgi:uncharacterized protein involved in cysteine biosynthesis